MKFQCSSASRKFLNDAQAVAELMLTVVSVLFSEPKIPQYVHLIYRLPRLALVSVLFSEPKIPQSAAGRRLSGCGAGFQCSSASRKFLNGLCSRLLTMCWRRFSALQRAENSSILRYHIPALNESAGFSALQRAENSSIAIRRLPAF